MSHSTTEQIFIVGTTEESANVNHTTGAAIDRVLRALGDAGRTYRSTGAGYEAQCANPSHADANASMSVRHNVDRVLIYCHVCGKESTPDIVAALGLTQADLFDYPRQDIRPGQPQVVDTYVYEGADSKEQYRRDRREPGKDGKDKDFIQYRMVAGEKAYGLGDAQRLPWRLPQVLAAIKEQRTVYWVEGEGCVRALEKIGEVATTAGGANDWRPHMVQWFDGAARVVVMADNDEPGFKHAHRVAEALASKAKEVVVVRGAVDQPKADIVEHLAAGHGLDELVPLPKRPDLRSVPHRPVQRAPTEGSSALQLEPAPSAEPTDKPEVGFDYATTFGLPKGVRTPKGYRLRANEVALKRVVREEETWAKICLAPTVVTAAYEDPDGEQSVEIAWTAWAGVGKPPVVVRRIVPRDIAKRGRELVKHLGSAGLPAIESDARPLERWLAEFEAANKALIPQRKLARHLGWQPDGSFVSSPEGDTRLDVLYEEQRSPAKAYRAKGTLEDWRDTIAGLKDFPVPRIIIAAAFAAPLLRDLGVNSFTVDVSSRSTKGKTTALQCGCSVWADPSEQSDAIANWRTTLYATEKRLNLVRGIITVLDETMAVTDETLIDQILYQLPMNHGKARGGGFASMLAWETILLSSGERPALSFTTSQGAAARILSTTTAPFGDNGGATAVATREGIIANYGHAGPKFVASILAGLARPGGRERLREQHRELKEILSGDTDMTARRAPMLAVLALAERLACKAGILPYEPLSDQVWQSMFTAYNPTDNRPEMAMDVVREFVAAHAAELFPGDPDRPPHQGWLGVRTGDSKGTRVALLPQRLKKILADAGYSLDAVVEGWIDAGYLETSESQRPKHLIARRFDGMRPKCYCFTEAGIPIDKPTGWAAA